MAKKAKTSQASEESTGLVPVIKKTAMSVDIGPMVISGFAQIMKDEREAETVLKRVGAKRYDLLSHLTLGIIKAATNDHSIDLTVAFKKDAKDQGSLNDQLGIALGFKSVQTLNEGKPNETKRVAWSREVADLVLSSQAEKDTDVAKQKATLRTNFIHALKKCCQAAQGMIDQKIKAKMDDKAGTLRLTGPAVKSIFGQPSVLLDEKQTIGPKGDDQIKLIEKPSFTALAAKAGEKRGVVVNRHSNTRGRSKQLANPTAALEDMTKSYLSIVNKLADKANEAQTKLFVQVRDRLDQVLGG